jgi:hypothetical protein
MDPEGPALLEGWGLDRWVGVVIAVIGCSIWMHKQCEVADAESGDMSGEERRDTTECLVDLGSDGRGGGGVVESSEEKAGTST